MYHYLNSIDEEEIDDREWIIEDDDEKINKRLIPRDYTFYKIYKDGCESYVGSTTNYYDRKVKHKSACNNPKSKKYQDSLDEYQKISKTLEAIAAAENKIKQEQHQQQQLSSPPNNNNNFNNNRKQEFNLEQNNNNFSSPSNIINNEFS